MANREKKKGMGRRKIEIKKIEKKSSLMVTFSKRRAGLFKKAAQLSGLCGADVAVLVKSPAAGKFHSFGTPSVDTVVDHFLLQNNNSFSLQDSNSRSHPHDDHDQEELLDEEKAMEEWNRFWWEESVGELGLHEVTEYMTALEGLRKNVVARADEMIKLGF